MVDRMKRHRWTKAGGVLLVAGMGLLHAAQADFEVTGPDGRRILLKDEGTWRHVEAKKNKRTNKKKGKNPAKETKDKELAKDKEPAKEKPKVVGEAVLRLTY